jgi:hypothetical protein
MRLSVVGDAIVPNEVQIFEKGLNVAVFVVS